jgi:hypothetical protein
MVIAQRTAPDEIVCILGGAELGSFTSPEASELPAGDAAGVSGKLSIEADDDQVAKLRELLYDAASSENAYPPVVDIVARRESDALVMGGFRSATSLAESAAAPVASRVDAGPAAPRDRFASRSLRGGEPTPEPAARSAGRRARSESLEGAEAGTGSEAGAESADSSIEPAERGESPARRSAKESRLKLVSVDVKETARRDTVEDVKRLANRETLKRPNAKDAPQVPALLRIEK